MRAILPMAVLPLALAFLAPGRPVRASAPVTDSARLAAALATWDTVSARALLQRGPDGVSRRDLPLLWGHLLLLEGDAAGAAETLSRAAGPTAGRLRTLAAGMAGATRDLAVATSPSGRFRIAYPPGPDEAMLPYLFEAAELAWDDLTRRLSMTVPTPVRILVLPSFDALSAATGLARADMDASGAVAVSAWNRIALVSPARLPRGYPYADTLAHELVHHFLTVRTGERAPLWLQEGLAKAWETSWRTGASGRLNRTLRQVLADAVVRGRLLPFSSFRGSLARLPSPEDAALAFAQLASFVAWIEATRGAPAIPRLLDLLARGTDEDDALASVAGRSLEELRSAWLAALVREGGAGPSPSGPAPVVLLRETAGDPVPDMTPDAAAQFRLGDLLRLEGRHGAAAGLYRRSLDALPTPHPEVVARLAGALVDAGLPDEALAALDAAAVDEDEFAFVARERGRALVRAGRFGPAEAALGTALRCDPWDPEAHEALARVFAATGRADLAEREQRLAGAWR